MSVKLILATGSRAGIEESLQHGFYMIGRHKECQIRPKTHSVSRRHCLLHYSDRGVRAFDLGSTNGTRINERCLKPNEWVWLSDGDALRCGKIAFRVSVKLGVPAGHGAGEMSGAEESEPTSLIKGEAWEDFDIVDFLETEDEAEREERYGQRRSAQSSSSESGEQADVSSSRSFDVTSLNLADGDEETQAVLKEARRRAAQQAESSDSGVTENDPDCEMSARARRIAAIRAKIEAERQKSAREHTIDHQISRMLRPRRNGDTAPASLAPLGKPAKARKRKRTIDAGMRFYAAAVVVAVAGSLFTYSVFRSSDHGQPRIVTGID